MRQIYVEDGTKFRRFAATLLATGALVATGLIASSPAQAAPRDNLANARLCLHQGWQSLKTANGNSFRNLGACVIYALRGGQFWTPPPPVDGGE